MTPAAEPRTPPRRPSPTARSRETCCAAAARSLHHARSPAPCAARPRHPGPVLTGAEPLARRRHSTRLARPPWRPCRTPRECHGHRAGAPASPSHPVAPRAERARTPAAPCSRSHGAPPDGTGPRGPSASPGAPAAAGGVRRDSNVSGGPFEKTAGYGSRPQIRLLFSLHTLWASQVVRRRVHRSERVSSSSQVSWVWICGSRKPTACGQRSAPPGAGSRLSTGGAVPPTGEG